MAAAQVGIGWRAPHYAELLRRRPALDFLEVHSENFFAEGGAALALLEQGRASYALSLHGVGLSLGSVAGLDAWHLEQLARLVQRVDPVRVSDHAAFSRAQGGASLVHAADLLPLPFTDAALALLCRNVQRVQERLQRPLLVENIAAYLRWRTVPGEAQWEEPEFLVELARRTGCQLLLDVNNLYVNARNACWDGTEDEAQAWCQRWLDVVPLGVVGEIHLAGHHSGSDGLIDDHGSRVSAPVWALFRYAVARLGPLPTLVEWDTDVPALDVLLEEAALAAQVLAP